MTNERTKIKIPPGRPPRGMRGQKGSGSAICGWVLGKGSYEGKRACIKPRQLISLVRCCRCTLDLQRYTSPVRCAY